MKRRVDYTWKLREVMAAHGMYATTALRPLLHDRGIDLSPSQVHRLVTGKPERLSLQLLAALCDIFEIEPGELIATTATSMGVRRVANGDSPSADQLARLRPRPARIFDED